jgi:protein-disulfide isomerase
MTESKASKAPKRRGSRLRPYLGTVVALAVVFGGSAAIGAHVRGAKETKVKVPTGASGTDELGLSVKPTVPVTLTVYEDLRSPASKAFAARYEAEFTKLLATGQVRIEYRLVTQSDTDNGGRGALAAANATACAQDLGRFAEYVRQLWAVQPADVSDDALAGDKLLEDVAKKAGKIDEKKFQPCVQGGDHDGWVHRSQAQFKAAGFTQAPVLLVNGTTATDATPKKLRKLVKQAVADAEAATTTP